VAGPDHVQLSFQGRDELQANEIAGTRAHAYKLKVAEWFAAGEMRVPLARTDLHPRLRKCGPPCGTNYLRLDKYSRT